MDERAGLDNMHTKISIAVNALCLYIVVQLKKHSFTAKIAGESKRNPKNLALNLSIKKYAGFAYWILQYILDIMENRCIPVHLAMYIVY